MKVNLKVHTIISFMTRPSFFPSADTGPCVINLVYTFAETVIRIGESLEVNTFPTPHI